MPEFQRIILEDEEVTYSEYESAIVAWRTCVQDAGYEPNDIEGIGAGQIGFSTDLDLSEVADPESAAAEFDNVHNQCWQDYAFYVATAWAESQVITDPTERDQYRKEFATCLRDAGVDVRDGDDVETLLEAALAAKQNRSMTDASEQDSAVMICLADADRLFAVSTKR
ncbi:MAG: hypothetical protein FWH11_13335 [Micrococcales bacterium]|nr:hypothetical protein [Micrococcales bacterium]